MTPTSNGVPTVIVGMATEARIARLLAWPVAVGGGTEAGARRVVADCIDRGAVGLISFGLAGGLDPALRPGAVIVPRSVIVDGLAIPTDAALSARLGGQNASAIAGATAIVMTAQAKRRLWQETGAASVDLESGAVARAAAAAAVPFAAVRVICDPADRDLPPAARVALDQAGAIGLRRVLGSLLRHPMQLPDLLRIAADAAAARSALREYIRSVSG